MASVRVAVRVRPLNQRERNLDSQFIIEMDGKKTSITNVKMSRGMGGFSREMIKDFTYDHSYWSVDPTERKYDSQEQVFKDLGSEVIKSAYDGYNACMFAYGQTGSGKTYTMMGSPSDPGLIPRICQELYLRMTDPNMTYRTEVSYLEIYNEKVRDLLDGGRTPHALRVREHPKEGPYVQDLSKHIVINYTDILELMNRGNVNRTTASTGMNDVSSRSHAIFTMTFTQAKFSQDGPSEMHSKIHLVDLAGSERADATNATGQRLKEGGSINKSLVTLGKIISTLADVSEKGKARKPVFIPYRDSVLTWLLKDSLGGNAKTIMVATISPADCNYAETLSTLRYANRAKNIINKPTVNEDVNVRLIRDLRDEISRLKALLGGKSDGMTAPRVQEKLHENEARVKVLTEEWTGKWKELAHILQEEKTLALRKEGLGVVLDSDLPHLIGIDDDILSTGIMLYHLKEGKTTMGTGGAVLQSDIVLQGEAVLAEHCAIEHHGGQVTLIPAEGALCTVNGSNVSDPVTLSQGAVILLGKTNMFRFNHPAQAAKLRQEFKESNVNLTRISSLSQSMNDLARSTENLALITSGWEMEQRHQEQLESLEQKRLQIEEMEERHRSAEAARTFEQHQQEAALEAKREQLSELAEQSNQTRREAEMMKKQMMEEAALLKRRSMDVERQYMLYMQKKTELEEQARDSSETSSEESEKVSVRRRVEEELLNLTHQEKLAVERARTDKERLTQELADLEENYSTRRAHLEAKVTDLEGQVAQRTSELEKTEARIEKEWLDLQTRREQEQEALERQMRLLEAMRSDHEAFYEHTAQLDEAARARLHAEHERLREVREEVRQREKTLYAEYSAELEAVDARRTRGLTDVQRQGTQLDADKVYLQECVARVEQAMSRMDSLSEEEIEQLERESIAIETERERIREDEERLEAHEAKVQADHNSAREELQRSRDEQIESLVYDKEKIKELEALRGEAVMAEIARSRQELTSLRAELEDKEKDLEEQEKIQKQRKLDAEEEVSRMEAETQTMSSQLLALEQTTLTTRETLQEKLRELALTLKQDMQNAETRWKMLEDLEKRQLTTSATEAELQDEKAQFEHYQKFKQGALLEQERYLADLRHQDELNKQKQDPELTQKIKDLEKLEEQLRTSEAELEENRARLERERQEELDRIDMEKFTLQEMEDQERINALVEQEVKRRLFEERVQREKQRRMEREKEKLEREKELSKIKKAHDREIQKLREKYETSNPHVNTNAPTKANPYANIMRTEHSGTHRRELSMERGVTARSMSVVPLEENRVDLSIPGYVQRGSTLDTHYEFEVKLTAGADTWSVYRRYSRFRELHQDLKTKYPQIGALVFPPKKWFSNRSEKVVAERRKLLEDYLRNVVQVLQRNPACSLHPSRHKLYTKQALHEFHPFFKKGLFETSKHGTG